MGHITKESFVSGGITFQVGAIVTVSNKGSEYGWGSVGERMIIAVINFFSGEKEYPHIGIQCPYPKDNGGGGDWGDLDGRCPPYQGRWFTIPEVLRFFNVPGKEKYVVATDLEVRGKNLKGMPCRILCYSGNTSMFIEFEENIGGCGADGLGRKGHCLLVDGAVLGVKTGAERQQHNQKKKNKKEQPKVVVTGPAKAPTPTPVEEGEVQLVVGEMPQEPSKGWKKDYLDSIDVYDEEDPFTSYGKP